MNIDERGCPFCSFIQQMTELKNTPTWVGVSCGMTLLYLTEAAHEEITSDHILQLLCIHGAYLHGIIRTEDRRNKDAEIFLQDFRTFGATLFEKDVFEQQFRDALEKQQHKKLITH